MNYPANLRYTKDHEWVLLEGNVATVGITDFAQRELGISYMLISAQKAKHCLPKKYSVQWKR